MYLFKLEDITPVDVNNCSYDILIFCSGFEKRCTHIPKSFPELDYKALLVFGFTQSRSAINRVESDRYYEQSWDSIPLIESANNDSAIFLELNKLDLGDKEVLRIFVDYSSMSRVWYTAVLNWCRYQNDCKTIIVDFGYSIGDYDLETEPMVIQEISTSAGFEGSLGEKSPAVAIFGLGFEGYAAMCIYDRLEPDSSYAILPNPAASEAVLSKSLQANRDFLNLVDGRLDLPMRSVESSFKGLSELVRPYLYKGKVTFVPMGPKPQVLASLLLAIRFPRITCLRVSGRAEKEEDVEPEGELVLSRIVFKSV